MEVITSNAEKIRKDDICIGSEIYMLNQDYGVRSGVAWEYEYINGAIHLFTYPIVIKKEKFDSFISPNNSDYGNARIAASNYHKHIIFDSPEEALAYINGVKKGIELMIDNMLGANEKLKMMIQD